MTERCPIVYTIGEIAKRIGGEVHGNPERIVRCVSPIEQVEKDSIVFVRDSKNFMKITGKKPACLILDFHPPEGEGIDFIYIAKEKKEEAFLMLLSLYEEEADFGKGISATALVSPKAHLEEGVVIGDFVVVGENTEIKSGTRIGAHTVIGKNCWVGNKCTIYPHVALYPNTRIEEGVIITSGAVIGSDGFGYRKINETHHKIPQIGGVHIGRNVEIGANTTIDRATVGFTKIGDGTKIDNLVQIAHNVEIGKNSIICAFCGISGSVKIGSNVVMAGGVGLADHIVIEDDVVIGARAGIMEKRVKRGRRIVGAPARDVREMMEIWAMRPKLKGMYFDLQKIKKKLNLE
jgi:UDP-3-O-[3-hydroxymyristoyl] glucosamine N-acyltransferase